MAPNTCAPCECAGAYFGSVESHRQAVEVTLCAILAASGGQASSTVATLTQVPYSATEVPLLVANDDRKANSTIINTSNANLYVGLGSTVSTSSYTYKVFPGAEYVIPSNFAGEVSGIWDGIATDGGANITELT